MALALHRRRLCPKPCEYCGTDFMPPRSRYRFCSRSCSASWKIRQPAFRDRLYSEEARRKIGMKIRAWLLSGSAEAKEKMHRWQTAGVRAQQMAAQGLAHNFWLHIRVRENGCWEWEGSRGPSGYGSVRVDGRSEYVHRHAWVLRYGPIPDTLHVLHRCDNPPCINPAHLFLGTNRDNVEDMCRKSRQAKGDRQGSRVHPETRACGEKNGRAKLTRDQVEEIRRDYLSRKSSQREIARRHGISQPTVSEIVNFRNWIVGVP